MLQATSLEVVFRFHSILESGWWQKMSTRSVHISNRIFGCIIITIVCHRILVSQRLTHINGHRTSRIAFLDAAASGEPYLYRNLVRLSDALFEYANTFLWSGDVLLVVALCNAVIRIRIAVPPRVGSPAGNAFRRLRQQAYFRSGSCSVLIRRSLPEQIQISGVLNF